MVAATSRSKRSASATVRSNTKTRSTSLRRSSRSRRGSFWAKLVLAQYGASRELGFRVDADPRARDILTTMVRFEAFGDRRLLVTPARGMKPSTDTMAFIAAADIVAVGRALGVRACASNCVACSTNNYAAARFSSCERLTITQATCISTSVHAFMMFNPPHADI